MAKKKSVEKNEMPAPAATQVKPVRLDLTSDVHRLLRLVAAHHDQSMASYARDVIEQHLQDEIKRLNINP